MKRIASLMRRLKRNAAGVAMVEFALATPFLLTAGLWGVETANFVLANMKINQLASHIADNASRIGDASVLQDRRIFEGDIADVLFGAQLQAGTGLGLFANGRVIISSLEVNDDDEQYIHWQRCRGAKAHPSSYGDEGDVLPDGMGPEDKEILALPDDATIFVEVNYTYQPLISDRFIGNREISSIASFSVRDDRDLSQIYQRDVSDPDQVQSCALQLGTPVVGADGRVT